MACLFGRLVLGISPGCSKRHLIVGTTNPLRDTVVTRWIVLIWAPGSIPGGENSFFSNPIIVSFEFFERFFIYGHPISGFAVPE